jgi:hypothetical protein
MGQYTGYSKEEFLAMSPFDILPEEGKALYAEGVRGWMVGKTVNSSQKHPE